MLKILQANINALKTYSNQCNKTYNIINIQCKIDTSASLKKKYFTKVLKLIIYIAKSLDIFNLAITLLFIIMQVIYCFLKYKNWNVL